MESETNSQHFFFAFSSENIFVKILKSLKMHKKAKWKF